jgi:type II secretory pathway pseudopilin PulG
MHRSRSQSGLAYLAFLCLVAILGAVLALAGVIWSTEQQREKERELLFIGHQFRHAIALYYERSPGYVKRYPPDFKDLLRDNRQVAMARYLRRVYRDPMTLAADWGVVRASDGGIMGVYSTSAGRPIKQANFAAADSGFENAGTYAQWRFIYVSAVPQAVSKPVD